LKQTQVKRRENQMNQENVASSTSPATAMLRTGSRRLFNENSKVCYSDRTRLVMIVNPIWGVKNMKSL